MKNYKITVMNNRREEIKSAEFENLREGLEWGLEEEYGIININGLAELDYIHDKSLYCADCKAAGIYRHFNDKEAAIEQIIAANPAVFLVSIPYGEYKEIFNAYYKGEYNKETKCMEVIMNVKQKNRYDFYGVAKEFSAAIGKAAPDYGMSEALYKSFSQEFGTEDVQEIRSRLYAKAGLTRHEEDLER